MTLKTVGEQASAQYGTITRQQARAAGVSGSMIARRLRSGEWVAVDDGVYLLPGATAHWLQRVMAACLATRGIASHLTAGHLWRLELPRVRGTEPIDVVVAAERRPRSTPAIHVHRTRLDLEESKAVVQGIPTSKLGPTLLQLAEVLDDSWLERAVDSAAHLRPGILFWLAATLHGPRRGHRSCLRFRKVLEDLIPDCASPIEARVLQVLRRARLLPTHQGHCLAGRRGRLDADFVWLPEKVVLQSFGYEPPHQRKRWIRDWEQLEDLQEQGWRLLVTHLQEVEQRPQQLVDRLREALRTARASPLGNG